MTSSTTHTILFTDLVGSTALRARLGDEAADEVYRAHFAALGRAIATHDGTQVKNLGDGVMAVFASVRGALDCSVSMQRATDRENRRSPERALGLRVGVSVGEVAQEDDDYFGTAVVEAARLCAAAAGGQVLVSAVTRLLAGSRAGHEMTSLGELELKGLAEPMATYAVEWRPVTAPQVPLPARLVGEPGPAFVGRERELALLTDASKQAAAGHRCVVMVAGEPGIGKTRLVAEHARAAYSHGVTVLYGRCDDRGGVAFRPFVEALRHYIRHTPDDELASALEDGGGELARLVPEVGRRVPGIPAPLVADPDTERHLLVEAVAALVARASHTRPLLLVLDDLHLADEATLLLVRHLVRSAEPAAALVVITYRDTDLRRSSPLVPVLRELRREPGVEQTELRGLGEHDVAALLEEALDHELGADELAIVPPLRRHTDGNPLFVAETMRALTAPADDAGAPADTTSLLHALATSRRVRDLVDARLAGVADSTRALVTGAAVVGDEFALAVAAGAAAVDVTTSLDAIDEAVAAGLVRAVPGSQDHFAFAHTVARTTILDGLGAARRARLHAAAADAVARQAGDDLESYRSDLARHLGEAAAVLPERRAEAGDALRLAAEQARAQLAYEDAAHLFAEALRFVTEPTARADLELAAGEAHVASSGMASGVAAFRRAAALAREIGDAERLARAAIGAATIWEAGTVDRDLVALVEEALDRLGPEPSPLRAQLLARLALELQADSGTERWLDLVDEATDIALKVADSGALRRVVEVLGVKGEPLDAVHTLASKLLSLAGKSEEVESAAWAQCHLSWWSLSVGDVAGSDEAMAEYGRAAQRLRKPRMLAYARVVEAMRATMRGDFAAAERIAADASKLAAAAQDPNTALVHTAQLWALRRDQGRLEELLPLVLMLPAQYPTIPAVRPLVALTLLEAGRPTEGAAELDRAVTAGLGTTPHETTHRLGLGAAAEAAFLARDPSAAEAIAPLLERLPAPTIVVGPQALWAGSVAYYQGVVAATLGDVDTAVIRLEEAQVVHERMGSPPWVVRAQHHLAGALVLRDAPGDRERAAELRADALSKARALGMARLVHELGALTV